MKVLLALLKSPSMAALASLWAVSVSAFAPMGTRRGPDLALLFPWAGTLIRSMRACVVRAAVSPGSAPRVWFLRLNTMVLHCLMRAA